jgi:hypothetical protein
MNAEQFSPDTGVATSIPEDLTFDSELGRDPSRRTVFTTPLLHEHAVLSHTLFILVFVLFLLLKIQKEQRFLFNKNSGRRAHSKNFYLPLFRASPAFWIPVTITGNLLFIASALGSLHAIGVFVMGFYTHQTFSSTISIIFLLIFRAAVIFGTSAFAGAPRPRHFLRTIARNRWILIRSAFFFTNCGQFRLFSVLFPSLSLCELREHVCSSAIPTIPSTINNVII